MARGRESGPARESSEESASESDDLSRRRARDKSVPQRKPKKPKEESSTEEESSSAQESSGEEPSPPPRRKATKRRSGDEELTAPRRRKVKSPKPSSDEESPPPRRKVAERRSGNHESPPPRRMAPDRRPKKIEGKDKSESDDSTSEPEPRRRVQASSPSRPTQTSRNDRGSQQPRTPRQQEGHKPELATARPKLRVNTESSSSRPFGLVNDPRSPPPGYRNQPVDQLARALAASTLEAQNAPKRPEWVDNDEETRKVILASEREAKKTPRREKPVDEAEELAKALALSKHEAKKSPRQEEFSDDKEQLAKVMAASKLEAKKSPRQEQFVDGDEDELRRVLELSQQVSLAPLRDKNDIGDEEFNKIIEESERQAAEHEALRQEVKSGKQREAEIMKESVLAAEEDKKKRKERQKLAEEEFKKQKEEAMAANLEEHRYKSINRKQASAWEQKRMKEIAEDERKRVAAEREQQRAAQRAARRTGREYRPVLEDSVDDPDFQAAMRESLGDQNLEGALDISETGLMEPPPSFSKIRRDKKIDSMQYTSSSRDIAEGGKCILISDHIRKEMIQYAVHMFKLKEEENFDPDALKPPAYQLTGEKAEKKALRLVLTPHAPAASARKVDVAHMVHGTVRPNDTHQRFGQRIVIQDDPRAGREGNLFTNDAARTRTHQEGVDRNRRMNEPFARIPRAGSTRQRR